MDSQLQEFADKTIQSALDLGCQYCDVRAEDITSNSSLIENGSIEHIKTESDRGIGIRIINNGAWGFFSVSNPQSINEIQEHLVRTVRHTTYYSENKKNPITLKSISANQKTIDFPVKEKPTLDDIIKIGLECDKMISEQNGIIKSTIHPWFSQSSKYFANSEGSQILQNFTDVVIDLVATAHESGLTQSVNITEGGRGGLEQIITAQQSAKEIASKASALIDAKPAKEEQATVVMNPDFVALLTHEILGHPSEADRVLGKEMAWAGGAWWSGKLGEKIGSDALNVFDNPTIEKSLGWYYFDDEGVPTQNTTLVENGTLKNHMQNRETAEIFGAKPTGNMRATSYQFMPLLRMACTCIATGDYNPDEMIKDVKNGYLISNMKIPSIDMKRYNWSISCQYAQKIENGEPTELLRDVIVMGIAPDFFSSIDACGKDFTVRPITNCGKGDPMQSMIMGNGGPTVRGVATVKSVN